MSTETGPSLSILRACVALLSVAVAVLFALVLRDDGRVTFSEIEAQMLTIVESDGTRRVVLSNEDRFPLPYLNGEEFERSIDPAGMVFYDRDGNETGGLGIIKTDAIRATRMIMDYQNTDGIGWGTWETPDGGYGAGFSIADRNDITKTIRENGTSEGTLRVLLQNDNQNAGLNLFDTEGRVRIRLSVTAEDEAMIEVLDEAGEVVARLP